MPFLVFFEGLHSLDLVSNGIITVSRLHFTHFHVLMEMIQANMPNF